MCMTGMTAANNPTSSMMTCADHRHENADRNDLQCPSLEPLRQTAWPYLEESEGSRRRQTEDDGAEEKRGWRTSPDAQHQEADADRHCQRDGNAPRCLRNDAGRSRGRRQFGHDLRIPACGDLSALRAIAPERHLHRSRRTSLSDRCAAAAAVSMKRTELCGV